MVVNLMDLTPEVNALVYGLPANFFRMDSLKILQGRRFHDDQPEVMLGEMLAENLGKKPGDQLDIARFHLSGGGCFSWRLGSGNWWAIMPLRQLQNLVRPRQKSDGIPRSPQTAPAGQSDRRILQKARRD